MRRWRSAGNHLLINTFVEDGWRAGLAAAGLSADLGGTMLVDESVVTALDGTCPGSEADC